MHRLIDGSSDRLLDSSMHRLIDVLIDRLIETWPHNFRPGGMREAIKSGHRARRATVGAVFFGQAVRLY